VKDQSTNWPQSARIIIMDGKKHQKTIPTVYNMYTSKAREVVWALEELADDGFKYNVVNLPRRLEEMLIHTKYSNQSFRLESRQPSRWNTSMEDRKSPTRSYRTSRLKRDSSSNSSLIITPTEFGSRDQRKTKRKPPSSKSSQTILYRPNSPLSLRLKPYHQCCTSRYDILPC
jgi:hypothetical protein